MFSEGDFVITTNRNVIGVMEVKSNIKSYDLCYIIEKANNNAQIIVGQSSRNTFNDIFSYNYESEPKKYVNKLNEHDVNDLVRK